MGKKKRISYANQVGIGAGKSHRSIKKSRAKKASGRHVSAPPSRPPSKKP